MIWVKSLGNPRRRGFDHTMPVISILLLPNAHQRTILTMLAEIELFLKENFNPETISLFYRGFNAFDTLYEDLNYQAPYVDVLMMAEEPALAPAPDRVRALLEQDVYRLITDEFEVQIDPETQLTTMLSILEGLIALPNYEDKDAIAYTIESGESTVEIFADLMEFVTDLKENEVMLVVESVPAELLTKLMENLDPQHDLEQEVDEQVDTHLIHKLKAYLAYTPNKNNFGFELIRSGYAIGAAFSQYQKASGTLLDTLEDIEDTTDQLLTLLYMSSDAYSNPLQFYTDHSSTIFSDDKRVTQVYGKIKNRIAQFEAVYTNQKIKDKGIANAQA